MKLLFEIGTEELPVKFLKESIEILPNLLKQLLEKNNLSAEKVESFGTPRRLTLIADGLPEKQPDKVVEIFGPSYEKAYDKNGEPTQALLGFVKKQGVTLDKVTVVDTKKGKRVCVKKEIKGKTTEELLKEILPEVVKRVPLPLSMKWYISQGPFIRPVHWIVALLDNRVIDFELFDIRSGRKTKGHRFMANKWLEINSPDDYFRILEDNFVIVDHEKRKRIILEQLKEILEGKGLTPIIDDELLEEVNFLVEYPVGILGEFSQEYLTLPEPVIIITMKHHQRYFPVVYKKDKRLAPYFVAFANTKVKDDRVVKQGYEKVLKARLTDAVFFYKQDRKKRLIDYTPLLSDIVFHERLGTFLDKVKRIEKIAIELGRLIGYTDIEKIKRASSLIKADLKTEMVYEFPELQGVIGEIYAKEDGEDEEVYRSIREHYYPVGEGGDLPETELGILMALSDKFDTLWGSWVVGERVTSTKDPLGLRRNAIGIIRITIEREVEYNLSQLWDILDNIYKESGIRYQKDKEIVIKELEEFIKGRLRSYFVTKQIKKDTIEAGISASFDNLLDLSRRISAIETLRKDKDFENLAVAFKRAFNIVNKEYKGGDVDPKLFVHPSEENLYKAVISVEDKVKGLIDKREYLKALKEVGNKLREPIDTFFDAEKGVFVMVEDLSLRNNRLAILKRVSDLVRRIAHFNKLQFEL